MPFALPTPRCDELDPDPERLQNGKDLADLTGRFSLLKVDDESNPCPGRECEILLRHTEVLSRFPHCLPNFLRCVDGSPGPGYSRTGIIRRFCSDGNRNLPEREFYLTYPMHRYHEREILSPISHPEHHLREPATKRLVVLIPAE